jgi:hypothetical protein
VLAVASLATQSHADVEHPATQKPIPLSLFLITIAESGERKSAADHGPACLRETAAVEQSLKILEKYGWCRLETVKTGGRDTKIVRLSPHARNAI